jgi:hypothetical protein
MGLEAALCGDVDVPPAQGSHAYTFGGWRTRTQRDLTAPVAAFALAHSLLLALAGSTGEWTLRFLAHREASRVVSVLRGVMGVSMVGAGLYLVAFGR